MRKISVLLFAVLFTLLCACEPVHVGFPSTVAVSNETSSALHLCHGVVADSRTVLTVAHIFDPSSAFSDKCIITDMNGNSYKSQLIYVNFALDLALISYENSEISAVLSVKRSPAFIKNIDGFLKCKNAKIRAASVKNKPARLWETEASLPSGCSGSAVVSADGSLVGLVCGKSSDGKRAYAIPADTIELFLSEYRESAQKNPPR